MPATLYQLVKSRQHVYQTINISATVIYWECVQTTKPCFLNRANQPQMTFFQGFCWSIPSDAGHTTRSAHIGSSIYSITLVLKWRFQSSHYWNSWSSLAWVSSVLRLHQHSIGYTGDGFYRSKDPTNSIKVLKEMLQKRKKTTKTTKYTYT